MEQEQVAVKWATFVKTAAYPEQLKQLHAQAEVTSKKLYSPTTHAGYIRFRNAEYTCHKTYYDEELIHPENCSTCYDAFYGENKNTQNYIKEKDRENRIADACADVLDHFQGIR